MRKEDIYDFVSLGGAISWLRSADVNFLVTGEKGVIDGINQFTNILEGLGLNVSYRASEPLINFKENLIANDVSTLTKEYCRELSKIANTLLPTLKAEIKGYEVFLITDKRYSIEKLTNKIHELFAPNVFLALPEIAQYDISQSGKCILVEVPTAAAFHILRATETVVKIYYKKFLRRNSQGKTWGQLLGELSNKNRGKLPNIITLNHLKNIKNSFRNPTQHPEKTYDINEAQDLFNLCVEVMSRMISELN